jgi:hypothetical protein
MPVPGAQEQITQTLLGWEGVSIQPHRFGGVEYCLGRRELGHIHGDHMLDVPFPSKVKHEILATGMASPHHLLPETGWVSLYLRQPEDVQKAIQLLKRSYEIARQQRQRRGAMFLF